MRLWVVSKVTQTPFSKSRPISVNVLRNGELRLKMGDQYQSHNILGYTVKVDVEGDRSQAKLKQKIGELAALTSPPTSVQFQTIANKPDAKPTGEPADPADPYNAFLFTEMTGGESLPSKDLQWSGNWFDGTTGGTMNVSGGIFLRDFVRKLVEPIHKKCTSFADPMVKRQT
jgi:hypothetical protein